MTTRRSHGWPTHRRIDAMLSYSRAIDTLMGKNPQARRAFYKSVKERESRHWPWVGASPEEREDIEAKKRQECERRFEPEVPRAFEFVVGLWDPVQGRSHANRWFRGTSTDPHQ